MGASKTIAYEIQHLPFRQGGRQAMTPLDDSNTTGKHKLHTTKEGLGYCLECGEPNQENTGNELDEILAKLSKGERDWIHDQLDGTSMVQENLEAVDKEVAEAKSKLTKNIEQEKQKAYWQGNQKAIIEESKRPRTTVCGICGELQAELALQTKKDK